MRFVNSAPPRPARAFRTSALASSAVALALLAAGPAASADATAPDVVAPGAPRVVELFTSHGCSSCPPADELLGRLLEADPSIVALEYHVDYWNELVHGGDGSFADPFSDAAHTARQRAYAGAGLAGRPGVYTPQMVVDGRRAMVGSDARRLAEALAAASPDPIASVTASRTDAGLRVLVRADPAAPSADALDGAEIVLLRYHERTETAVTGGENRHRTMLNHRVVHGVEPLGTLGPGDELVFDVDVPADGDGCAVLVQDRALTTLHAAALCPS